MRSTYLLLLLISPCAFATNLARLIKHLDIRLNQLIRDQNASSATFLAAINQMNGALSDLTERVANPRSHSGILRLGQAVISSGTPHFVKVKVSGQELQRRYQWSKEDLKNYYELIQRTIDNRRSLDSVCRKVSLEVKVYNYYYNNRNQLARERNKNNTTK